MKTYRVRIKDMPNMAYGGQRGYNLDLGRGVSDNQMREDSPYQSVSDTLQPVPREEANLEAERGETVVGDLDGDGTQEHMKIGGKRHSQGGTPLNLNPGSFIFSDTKKMRVGGPALEMFGKGANAKKKYTPAQLAKQYDLNKYKSILDDPLADPLKKQTAQIMMDNNQKKLGQLALLQESMKGFPQGIPDIAQSAMPQAAYGGLTEYQTKGQVTEDYRKRTPVMNDLREQSFNSFNDVANYYGDRGYTGNANNVDQWQKWMIETAQRDPEFNSQFTNYLKNVPLTNKGKKMYPGKSVEQLTNEQLKGQFNDGLYDFRAPRLMEKVQTIQRGPQPIPVNIPLPTLAPLPYTFNPSTPTEEQPVPGPTPGKAGPKYTMPNAGYLLPDKLAGMQALATRATLPTIKPFVATPGYVKPSAVFMDPTRDYAANAEMANMQMQGMRTFGRPQQFLAGASQVAGRNLAANEANAGAVNKQNVMIANQYETQGAQMDNQYLANRAQANTMYNEMANNALKENFRNQGAADNQLLAAYSNAFNNRAMVDGINATNPYFMIDSRTGFAKQKDPNQDINSMIRGARGAGAAATTYPEMIKYATETLKMPMDKATAWADEQMKQKGRTTTTDRDNDSYPDFTTVMNPFMQLMTGMQNRQFPTTRMTQ